MAGGDKDVLGSVSGPQPGLHSSILEFKAQEQSILTRHASQILDFALYVAVV